ncbi:F-box/kelch-repeat protein At3g23880-like [Bidens hawaiensis]|uniref:F-box/kelch-repeat protein At3g23880-like n=1 Tax=Bidens hawaiensis TaxID=980011 RepID=UPI004049F198
MMSHYNYLPLEIQEQIMKWLPVKSLIRFRSVSKTWKSYIDSAGFVASYSSNKQHIWVQYYDEQVREERYLSIVDDDTFALNRVNLTPLPLPDYTKYIGCSDGLLCFYLGCTAFFWNPSIRRGFHLDVPIEAHGCLHDVVLGFGVCRETNDLKIVKITCVENVFSAAFELEEEVVNKVDVWTLSTRAWRSLPANAILTKLYFSNPEHAGRLIAIGGVVYWLASEEFPFENLIISFDITTEELGEVDLPDSLANPQYLTISKLRESLVVLQNVEEPNRMVYNLWMMEGGVPNSFTKIFTFYVNTPSEVSLMGFRQRGDPIIRFNSGRLVVYESHSRQIDNLGFDGVGNVSFVQPYTETLLLHDQPNLTIDTEVVQDQLASFHIRYAL